MAIEAERDFGVEIHLVKTEMGLPKSIREHALKSKAASQIFGAINPFDDSLWLVTNNLKGNKKEIQKTIFHEIIGHYGVRKILGERLNPVLDLVWNNLSENQRNNLSKLNETKDKYILAQEYIAEMATKNIDPTFYELIVSKIRELLRKMFPNLSLNQSEVKKLLQESSQYLRDIAKLQNENIKQDMKIQIDFPFLGKSEEELRPHLDKLLAKEQTETIKGLIDADGRIFDGKIQLIPVNDHLQVRISLDNQPEQTKSKKIKM